MREISHPPSKIHRLLPRLFVQLLNVRASPCLSLAFAGSNLAGLIPKDDSTGPSQPLVTNS